MASFVFMTAAPDSYVIANLSGSGLAFYDGTFGTSVPVGSYNRSTQVSNSLGTVNGPLTNNIRWINSASGIVNEASSGIPILNIPNYLCTVMPEFQHSTPVKLQNTKVYLYDRSNINNSPSGVVCKVAELIHPTLLITDVGSGSPVWQTPAGSSYMSLTPSPGTSGLYPNGPSTTDTLHRHHLAITCSPSSIGSKLFALYIETEYL